MSACFGETEGVPHPRRAPVPGKPCFAIREETEWVELLELCWNRLVLQEPHDIEEVIKIATRTNGKHG